MVRPRRRCGLPRERARLPAATRYDGGDPGADRGARRGHRGAGGVMGSAGAHGPRYAGAMRGHRQPGIRGAGTRPPLCRGGGVARPGRDARAPHRTRAAGRRMAQIRPGRSGDRTAYRRGGVRGVGVPRRRSEPGGRAVEPARALACRGDDRDPPGGGRDAVRAHFHRRGRARSFPPRVPCLALLLHPPGIGRAAGRQRGALLDAGATRPWRERLARRR